MKPLTSYSPSACLHLMSMSLLLYTAIFTPFALAESADGQSQTQNTRTLSSTEHLTSQIEWIQSNGGYYSPKIDYRNLIPNDPSSPLGMFVSSAVDEEEILMIIPHQCLLTTGTRSTETCDTVHHLAHEFTLGDESDFFPYVRYCFDERHDGDLPTTWSEDGKKIIQQLVGRELFPGLGITEMTYDNECGDGDGDGDGSTSDKILQDAYHHVLRRSWDDIMIPVFDMINHRNGIYKNVDSNSAHTGNDIYVVALRDIEEGEQLYLSYNECTDCVDYAYTYILPDILRDYGFVEQFPQRWNLFGGELMFQLEEKNGNVTGAGGGGTSGGSGSDLKLTWLGRNGAPDRKQARELQPYLHGHLHKLNTMPVSEMTQALSSSHESYTIMEFHKALTTALKHVLYFMEDVRKIGDQVQIGGSRLVPVTYGVGELPLNLYDDFDDYGHGDEDEDDGEDGDYDDDYNLSFEETMCSFDNEESRNYNLIDKVQSFYQEITFHRNDDTDDICMRLDGHLESCQRNRAHYHETLVHYAASFIPDVKRVMFLGGGDNMILHEVLKYEPSLELVVGLELDKVVCQSSFKNFETQPHFDHDKVEWWFGDAVQSLKLLPEEYVGTFDLIFVDLQTSIVAKIGIMETLAQFIHPEHGVIIRNEDGGFGTNDPFAYHSVDLYSGDVPLFCHQGITMGSNAVDFTTAPRTQHDISTLYYDLESNRFNMWYNYRKVDDFANPELNRRIREAQQTGTGTTSTASAGVLMVLELEQLSLSEEKIFSSTISNALENAGLSISTSMTLEDSSDSDSDSKSDNSSSDHDTTVFIAEEGYVVARVWAEKKYCAFDIMLWSNYGKMYKVEQDLISSLGSGLSSSYRIVTGGIAGIKSTISGDEAKDEEMKDEDEDQTCAADATGSTNCKEEEKPDIPAPESINENHVNIALNATISSLMSSHSNKPIEIFLLCGEESQPCGAMDVSKSLSLEKETKLTIVHACPDSESIFACESTVRSYTRKLIENKRKVDAILVDSDAPKQSGQILHKILDRAELRGQLLSDKFVVVGVSKDPSAQSSSSSWLRVLLERFRTDFVPYNPSFHSDMLFHVPNHDGSGSNKSLGVSTYSAGNPNFYGDLVQAITWIKQLTGLSSDVRYVKDGLNNYVADFAPSKAFAHADYDVSASAAREQRKLQKPLGRQSVIQFEAKVGTRSSGQGYTAPVITSGLQKVLSQMQIQIKDNQIRDFKILGGSGDGIVIVALWEGGSAIALYDGSSRLDLNLFTQDQDQQLHEQFEAYFLQNIPSIGLKLRDVQPRGIGRAIAF